MEFCSLKKYGTAWEEEGDVDDALNIDASCLENVQYSRKIRLLRARVRLGTRRGTSARA